jgi:peptidoglycan/LPS O-acetylase OafA/YrhL
MGGPKNSFDLLRLVAALMVVVAHTAPLQGRAPASVGFIEDFGALGVAIFFVISGYLVAGSWERSRGVLDYLAKRLLRIWPALAVALLLTAFFMGPMVTNDPGYWRAPQTYLHVLKNMALYPVDYRLPGVFTDNPESAVNGSLWTLRLEFTCYLGLMALGMVRLLTPRVTGVLAVLAAGAFLTIQTLAPDWGGEPLLRWGFLGSRVAFLFLAGAWLHLIGGRAPNWMVMVGALLLATPAWAVGLPAVVIALGRLRGPQPPADISYGMYIYAFPIQQVLMQFGLLSAPAAIAATLPFAIASWFMVEKPALKLKPRAKTDPRV